MTATYINWLLDCAGDPKPNRKNKVKLAGFLSRLREREKIVRDLLVKADEPARFADDAQRQQVKRALYLAHGLLTPFVPDGDYPGMNPTIGAGLAYLRRPSVQEEMKDAKRMLREALESCNGAPPRVRVDVERQVVYIDRAKYPLKTRGQAVVAKAIVDAGGKCLRSIDIIKGEPVGRTIKRMPPEVQNLFERQSGYDGGHRLKAEYTSSLRPVHVH